MATLAIFNRRSVVLDDFAFVLLLGGGQPGTQETEVTRDGPEAAKHFWRGAFADRQVFAIVRVGRRAALAVLFAIVSAKIVKRSLDEAKESL